MIASLSDKYFLGNRTGQLDIGNPASNISRVNLAVDSENYYTAGDDTGRTIEVTCPWGTQDMANAILASVQGYSYQPYTAEESLLDPAVEVGDAVTVGGIYSVIATANITVDRLFTAEISAPETDEIDDEYPYESFERREYDREIARTRSMIKKSSEEILLQVESEIDGLSSSISVRLDSITSQVNGLDNQVSSIEQYVDSITLSVSNGSTSSIIQLKAGNTTISSQNIEMSGLVTFTGLANGTTTIDGECIKTGQISANRLDLTGEITFSDLSTSVRNDINDAYSMAEDAQTTANDTADTVDSWTYPGTTHIDGTSIMTGTVSATTLEGGSINLLDGSGRTAGSFTLEGASSYSGRKVYINSGAIEIEANYGDIFLESGNGTYVQLMDTVRLGGGDVEPSHDDRYSCGTSVSRWDVVYAVSSTISTSDRNLKNSITYDMGPYDALFDRLKPTPYKFNGGTSNRTHIGMISQDVEQALTECGLQSTDFAGFVKGDGPNGTEVYSLRYEEFIGLCIDQIQRLKSRVTALEGKA